MEGIVEEGGALGKDFLVSFGNHSSLVLFERRYKPPGLRRKYGYESQSRAKQDVINVAEDVFGFVLGAFEN